MSCVAKGVLAVSLASAGLAVCVAAADVDGGEHMSGYSRSVSQLERSLKARDCLKQHLNIVRQAELCQGDWA